MSKLLKVRKHHLDKGDLSRFHYYLIIKLIKEVSHTIRFLQRHNQGMGQKLESQFLGIVVR